MYSSKYLAFWPCGDINDTFIEAALTLPLLEKMDE